jgi:hypothetical protein
MYRKWLLQAALLAVVAGALIYVVPALRASFLGNCDRVYMTLQSLPGFLESLTLIFMCELGDKTFFLAGLLSMKLGHLVAFFGSVASLFVMTVVSVLIGVLFAHVPPFLRTSMPIGQYVGAALLFYFGAPPLALPKADFVGCSMMIPAAENKSKMCLWTRLRNATH